MKEIKSALKERAEEWPDRTTGYYKFVNLKNNLILEFESESQKNKFNKDIFDFVLTLKPIIVCGSMKSGTSFFKSLFDGHKNIFVLPAEPKIYRNFINNQTKKKSVKEIADLFLNIVLSPTGREPFLLFGETKDTYLDFYKNFQSVYEITKKISFVEVLYCFVELMHRKKIINYKDLKYFLVKTPENEFYYDEIKNYLSLNFPNTGNNPHFLHIVRNPIQNIDSLKKLSSIRNNQFNFMHTLSVVMTSHFLSKKREDIEKYDVLRYEDITFKTNSIMNKISRNINIEFDDCMKSPTEFGMLCKNNSMKKKLRNNPAGAIYTSEDIENLTKEEIEYIKASWEFNLNRKIDENTY